MNLRPRTLCLLLLVYAVTLSACSAEEASPSPAPSPSPASTPLWAERVQAAASKLPFGEEDAPGAIIAIAEGKDVKFLSSYGVESFGAPNKPDVEAQSRIGSITKTFVATVILQLIDEKKLTLATDVSTLALDLGPLEGVTVAQLLSMKSGIADLLDGELVEAIFSNQGKFWTERELVTRGLAKPRVGKPGEKFDYSNTNYHVLTLIIEKLTQKPYADAITERILKPLALKKTGVPGANDRALPPPALGGYEADAKAPKMGLVTSAIHPSYAGGAGSMHSSARDLVVYARAFARGELVTEAGSKAMMQPFSKVELSGFPFEYGYGTMKMGSWIGHSGSLLGYSANMYYHPSTDTTVVMLVSGGAAVLFFKPIAEAVVPGSF
jgi:D-alanyl-D-alanine carboxypeptidase